MARANEPWIGPVSYQPSDQSIAPSASHFVINALNSRMVHSVQ